MFRPKAHLWNHAKVSRPGMTVFSNSVKNLKLVLNFHLSKFLSGIWQDWSFPLWHSPFLLYIWDSIFNSFHLDFTSLKWSVLTKLSEIAPLLFFFTSVNFLIIFIIAWIYMYKPCIWHISVYNLSPKIEYKLMINGTLFLFLFSSSCVWMFFLFF